MPAAGPYAGLELIDLLNDHEIEFYGEHVVKRIQPDGRVIHFENGNAVEFDLLVFVPPHEPAVTLDGPGWINVDATTMETKYPGVFAIGDVTTVTSPSGRSCQKRPFLRRTEQRPPPPMSCAI